MENLDQQKYDRVRKRVKEIASFYRHLLIYILVNAFLITLKYFRLDPGEEFLTFNTFTVAFFWGIGLLFHLIGVFGPTIMFGSDWEQRKIDELMEKEKDKKWK